ncbi:MAG: sigma-70 family RNA polymerase sigma factor [Planctomycetota bacterium]
MTAEPLGPPAESVDLRAVKVGGAGARAELYRTYAPVVHGIAVASVGYGEAEDVTHEVFLKVFRRIDELRDPTALGAWVCGIARNAARDWLRRRRRRVATSLDTEVAAAEPPDVALADRVLALVRTLPEAYRDTLVLRLVEGLTGPEIAARTGMTHGSVRVNLHRGMGLLRPLLESEGWR